MDDRTFGINNFNKILFNYVKKNNYISVIIPVYNDILGLQDTLNTLITQSITRNEYEIIVANDGGNHHITKICGLMDIKVLNIYSHLGSYYARNSALAESRGEYIAFTDANVLVPYNWLKKGRESLMKADYIGGQVKFPYKSNAGLVNSYEINNDFNIKYMFYNEHFFPTANMFTKREVIEKIGGFDTRLKSGGDNEFGNRVHHFTIYSQNLVNNPVTHPYRTLHEIIKKRGRIIRGWSDLLFYFPTRYDHFKYYYINSTLDLIIPPKLPRDKQKLFFITWLIRVIDLFYILKNFKKIQLIDKNSNTYRLVKFFCFNTSAKK